MTGFDIIVLLIVGVAAVGGFMRGFVQEVLSLASWVLAVVAIRVFHTDLTGFLVGYVGAGSGAAVLAFVLLLAIPYMAMMLIARWAGRTARNSVLGPFDRVLGFGFGSVKGIIIAVMGFSVLVLGYDTIWGPAGRPAWMVTSRTYPLIDASAEEMVQLIAERRRYIDGQEAGVEGADDDTP